MTSQFRDINFNNQIPLYEQKARAFRAFLIELQLETNPLYARVLINKDSIEDYASIMQELSLWRNGLDDIDNFYPFPNIRFKDVHWDMSNSEIELTMRNHIAHLEMKLEEYDKLIDQQVSQMLIQIYFNDLTETGLLFLEQVMKKIKELGGNITEESWGYYQEGMLHKPKFIQVEFDNK